MYGWLGRAITFIPCHETGFKVVSPQLALSKHVASQRCHGMCILRLQFVIIHMLHLKGVFKSILCLMCLMSQRCA